MGRARKGRVRRNRLTDSNPASVVRQTVAAQAAPLRVTHNPAMWTPEDMSEQQGRVAVVTGANSGLGFEVARVLARRGATVVMAARNQDKARVARDAITTEVPAAVLQLRELDLASLDSVRACAQRIAADHERVDLLVNNAGIMAVPEGTTADGFERQLGVNHLGHFVLTRHLLSALLAAPAGRVVAVTSVARFLGRAVRPDNPHLRGRYDPWRAYSQSKLANLLFAVELQRRLQAAAANVMSVASHPGVSYTDLWGTSVRETEGGVAQRFLQAAVRWAGTPAGQGALALLRAATDPVARGGELYGPRWLTSGPPVRRPVLGRPGRAAQVLWAVSERETGERFDVAAISDGAA